MMRSHGKVRGAWEDRAGISNARLCPRNTWGTPSISMQADRICSSRITRTRSHSPNAATVCQFANYWMHNGYITIDNEKMSKVKGQLFHSKRHILKDYDGEVIRFFLLSGHYRNPINFSDTLMEQAKAGLARMQHAKENLKHLIATGDRRR